VLAWLHDACTFSALAFLPVTPAASFVVQPETVKSIAGLQASVE